MTRTADAGRTIRPRPGVVSAGAWLLLALAGRSTQLRLLPNALRSQSGSR